MNETQTHRGGGSAPPAPDAPTRIDLPTQHTAEVPHYPSGAPGTVGGTPFDTDDSTGASADQMDERIVHGPMPWAMGILNVLFSAVLAVVWLWIPVSLFVSGVAGVFALGFGIIFLLFWFLLQRGINHLERLRSEAVYGEQIRVPQTRTTLRTGFVGWLHQQWLILTSAAFWRSTAHSLVKTLYGGTIGILLLAGLGFGTFALALAINPTFLDASDVSISNRAGLGVLGSAAIVVAILILAVSPLLDRQIDRGLLPSTRAAALRAERDSLTHEVGALETARTGAVDAATAERLRIERDLHDGVQPQLVNVAMTIDMARRAMTNDPDAQVALALLDEAHSSSKEAITSLRQTVRGIHPAVLTDRGLDAALSALAARATVPVDLNVDLPRRPAADAEAAVYFVVAEALHNVGTHAYASSARVVVRPAAHDETRLQVIVSDDGAGGATLDAGPRHTGLRGMRDRLIAVGGTLEITSPAGGPTTIVGELPCGS